MHRSHLVHSLVALSRMSEAISNTGDWAIVSDTDIHQNLDTCAQDCVGTVNEHVFDVGQLRFCQSVGCVCSNSTRGPNYLQAESSVESCVRKACGDDDKVERAILALSNLCLVAAVSETQPAQDLAGDEIQRTTSVKYPDLTECAKFCLNGCLDVNGTRNEANCGPIKEPVLWEDYHGVAAKQGCLEAECMCKGPNFDISVGVALNAGIEYCAMWPSTADLPNSEADDMLAVLATFCTGHGFPPQNYTFRLSGVPADKDDDSNNFTHATTIAQVVLSGLALVVAMITLYIQSRRLKLTLNAPKLEPKQ